METVECELARLLIDESGQKPQMVMLREKGGDRALPIMIGIVEAIAINRKLADEELMRPMTHDLICNMLEALDAELVRITVTDLDNGTFYALLTLRVGEDQVMDIDCRPSDAISLAVRVGCPIYVAEHVLDEAQNDLI